MTIDERLLEMLSRSDHAKAAAQLLILRSSAAAKYVEERRPDLAEELEGDASTQFEIKYRPRPDPANAYAGQCLALRMYHATTGE